MLAESVIGIVRAVNGLLEKVNAQGQASLVKSGARLQEGDVLTLLSGEAYIQFIHGFPEALALGKPVNLYGVSPALQYGVEELNEQLVQEALAKGIDPSVILDVLGSAAAGAEAVGSGGDAFIMDPLFGFGHVTAGYPTGPISFAYEADTQQLFWFVPEETGVIAESELTQEPESIPQIPQFTTNQAVLTVFEDALPSGIADSAGQARIASSSLSSLLTSSADVAASFAFNSNLSALPTLKSGGIDLSYELSADKRTLTLRESNTQGPGAEVMKFELTADGQLTQTLMNSIDHPTADSDDGEWMRLDLSPLIDVTFTRTSDGSVLESRTLPANAVVAGIQDDVPIARAQLTNNEILLDETIGMKAGDADAANDDFNPTTTVDPFNNTYGIPIGLVQNANLLDTSTSEMGGDYKNATMTHLLKITDAVSGLQTTDGTPINLFLESNGDISGRAGDIGAPAVFAIRMNPNTGAITVAQYGSIKQFDTNSHDEAVDLTGRISAVVRVTDGDGDVSNAEIPIGQRIVFEDDGPIAQIAATGVKVTHDETAGVDAGSDDVASPLALFAGVSQKSTDMAGFAQSSGAVVSSAGSLVGQDNEGATIKFSLAIANAASGLQTTDGDAITLTLESGFVVGRDAGGDAVFAIAIDADTGVLSLAQYESIKHPSGGASYDEAVDLSGKINAVVTVTDGDGDVATQAIGIGDAIVFEDDGPVAQIAATGVKVTHDETAGVDAGSDDVASPLALFAGVSQKSTDMAGFAQSSGAVVSSAGSLVGQDNEGATIKFSLAIANAASGLQTTDGDAITLTLESGFVVGRDAGGDAVFAIAIDADTGVLSLAQYESIKHPSGGASYDEAVDLSGKINAVVTVTDGDGDVATQAIGIGDAIVFEDDGPVAQIAATGVKVTHDETAGVDAGSDDVASPLSVFVGVVNKSTDMAGFAQSSGAVVSSAGSVTGQDNEGATIKFSLAIA
ncbi:enhanced entry virulence factor RtxA, partial [Legionella pneumophila serogroup 1]